MPKSMISLSIILLAQAATVDSTAPVVEPPALPFKVSPPAPPASKGVARPMDNPANWVTTADYPTAALRANEQGTTGFSVIVNTAGRVKECRITSSSGFPSLDATTCMLVTRRARFTPAVDEQNNPIEGSYSNRVRWVLPAVTPPEPGTALTTFIVEPDGSISDCKITLTGAAARQLSKLGNTCASTARMDPYKGPDGKPVRKRVTMRVDVATEVVADPAPPAP